MLSPSRQKRESLRRDNNWQKARWERTQEYLIERQKEPMFPIAEKLANELGDIAPGTMITMREFTKCLWRLADIRAGKVQRSTLNEELARQQNAKLA